MYLRLEVRGLLRMIVRFRITQAGNDLHTLHCEIEDGPTRQYSYDLGGRAGANLSYAPELGRAVATFLLEEVEKRLGRRLLQSPASPPAQTLGLGP
ncbi:MAG: hypothetical protein ABEL51_04680 [Salinibacter sp.]